MKEGKEQRMGEQLHKLPSLALVDGGVSNTIRIFTIRAIVSGKSTFYLSLILFSNLG